jgi:methyl-accepting chemotaxis protein
MIDTLTIYEKLKDKMDPAAAEGIAEVLGSAFTELQESMSEKWFRTLYEETTALRREVEERFARIESVLANLLQVTEQHSREIAELRQMVRENTEAIAELREAVNRLLQVTEQHSREIAELRQMVRENTEAIAELREATQRNTEAIAELREATQRNTEAIAELREATQRNTEAIAELREAVNRLLQVTEQHSREIAELRQQTAELVQVTQQHSQEIGNLQRMMQQLIQVQQQTQEDIRRLTQGLDDLRKQVGGLSITVGYTIENEAYKALPRLLARDFGIEIEGDLKRQFVADNTGEYIEVNIFGQARRNGDIITIVGESKAQLSKNDVDAFVRRKLQRLQGAYPNPFPILVTHMISERDVEEYARQQGIAVYYSYQF